jgi:hypothetical protein
MAEQLKRASSGMNRSTASLNDVLPAAEVDCTISPKGLVNSRLVATR